MARIVFQNNQVEKRENNFELIPASTYLAHVIQSDVKPTSTGGEYIELVWEILSEGPFRNRRIWDRINIKNKSQVAERIGQQSLRELNEALGLERLEDTAQLHNKPVMIRTGIERDKEGKHEDKAVVKGYKPAQGTQTVQQPSAPAPAGSAPAPAAAPATPPANSAPWAKRA
jgi:hypothetical protein